MHGNHHRTRGVADPSGHLELARSDDQAHGQARLPSVITNPFDKGIRPTKLLPDSTVITRKQLVVFTTILLALAGGIGIALVTKPSSENSHILLPTLATVIIFLIFSKILKWQVGCNLFGELGFLYMAFAVAYTLFPALAFIVIDLNPAFLGAIENLLPIQSELGIHLWRHVLFVFGVAVGYLLVRGRRIPQLNTTKNADGKDDPTIVFLIGMTAICILCLSLLSAPVENYIENYIRYDHLSWFSRKFISVCVRLKLGMYCVLIVFLFRNYKKYKLIIPIIVAIICTYETVFSFGARIESLIVLLMAACSYNYFVKSITLKRGLIAFIALAVLFSTVELFRSYEFDVNLAKSAVSDQGFKPASEFGAVFITGFHLYAERAQGALPPTEWPMFFNDLISLVTFGDFTRWNPMDWYARNYYPDSLVAPFTLGPIADSAIWGGEIDLLLRSLINGAFFAYLVRWFIRHKDKWWGVTVYIYCYATCILTLKYSVFFHLNPLMKTVLPTLLAVGVVRWLIPSKRRLANNGGQALPFAPFTVLGHGSSRGKRQQCSVRKVGTSQSHPSPSPSPPYP